MTVGELKQLLAARDDGEDVLIYAPDKAKPSDGLDYMYPVLTVEASEGFPVERQFTVIRTAKGFIW